METATITRQQARPAHKINRRNVVLGIFAMTLVGSSVGVSHALVDAPLFTAQAIRYAIATVLLFGYVRATRTTIARPRGRDWLWLAGIAATGLVIFNVAVVRGVSHAEPAVIAVAVACVPIVIGVIGPLLERKRPRASVILAALVVTAGGVLVEGAGRTDLAGIGWAVVTLLCEAGFTLLAVPVLGRLGAVGVSFHAVWIATVMLAVLSVVFEGPLAVRQLQVDDWFAIGHLSILVTAIAFICWYSAVSGLGSGRAGLLTGIAPIAAALTGIVLVDQVPGPLVWLGMIIVGAGLAAGLSIRTRSLSLSKSRTRSGRGSARPA